MKRGLAALAALALSGRGRKSNSRCPIIPATSTRRRPAASSAVLEKGRLCLAGLSRVDGAADDDGIPALINTPGDMDAAALRPGMSGTATAYAPNSAPFDFFDWVLLFGTALALYL